VALATVDGVTFSYPGSPPALRDVSLELEPGEVVALLGPSGSGKSSLLRALSGLVPHFHGGRFAGRVVVDGRDTRRTRPAELAGTVATLFQDPEDQVVMTKVANEVAFGLENLGVEPGRIWSRAEEALEAVGAVHLAMRPTAELSGGELQRVCLAATLALEPRLLLLDEPTSQLDPEAGAALVALACRLARERGVAVVLSEHRPALPLEHCDRVVFLEDGAVALDASMPEAHAWLAARHPAWVQHRRPQVTQCYFPGTALGNCSCEQVTQCYKEATVVAESVSFAYADGVPVLQDVGLTVRRGEVAALVGPNGSGKTTLAKLAAGLLQPGAGRIERAGRAAYLSQDPGRYIVTERVLDEVALATDTDRARAALAELGLGALEDRHPRDLSSGERERLALACVLATDPDLLVLDEPTRGVDPERKRALAAQLREGAGGRATLVASHDAVFVEAVADRVVSLAPEREAVHA
jgi:energy-coupling factor transporter ATP-binding protein EcfA2